MPSMPWRMAARRSASSDASGDCGRGGVGQEDEDAHRGDEEGRSDAETGQLCRAEMADDGGVDHQEERLGDERAEGRNSQRDDLAIVSAPGGPAGRGSLCHDHQSNLPQVRDAMG